MQIGSTFLKPSQSYSSTNSANARPAGESKAELPQDQFTFDQERTTPTYVKAGKYALATATTAAAGALAYYASTNVGPAATVAGVLSGGLAGVTVVGGLGLLADVGGGIMGNSNHAVKGAIGGAIGGVIGGGIIGASVQSPVVGTVMGLASGLSALAVTGAATNILHK